MEIYNPTGEAKSLDLYQYVACANGCSAAGVFDFTLNFPSGKILYPYSSYVLCHSQASAAIKGLCDEEYDYIIGSGDDVFALLKHISGGSEIIDMVGLTTAKDGDSADKGPWSVCGVSGATKDQTLRRSADVCHGNWGDWAVDSTAITCTWDVFSKDAILTLGEFCDTTGYEDTGGSCPARTHMPTSTPTPEPSAPTLAPIPTPPSGLPGDGSCATAPTDPEDRRQFKGRLRVAEFNVAWLFLEGGKAHGSSVQCPCVEAGSSNCCDWDLVTAEVHLRYIALEIMRIDADIVNFAEVQDCIVLQRLLDLLPPEHGYKPYLVLGDDHALGQNVGIITRVDPVMDLVHSQGRAPYPVSGTTCPSSKIGEKGCSKHYLTRFHITGLERPLTLVGAHLLSNPSDASRCLQREAQAQVLRELIDEYHEPGDNLIILGDMNDFDAAAPDVGGQMPISQVLQMLKLASGDEAPLINAAELIPSSHRFSEWWDRDDNCEPGPNEFSLLDHLLFNIDIGLRVNATIHNQDWYPQCAEAGGYNSDHWPFSITVTLFDDDDGWNGQHAAGDDACSEMMHAATFDIVAVAFFTTFTCALLIACYRNKFCRRCLHCCSGRVARAASFSGDQSEAAKLPESYELVQHGASTDNPLQDMAGPEFDVDLQAVADEIDSQLGPRYPAVDL